MELQWSTPCDWFWGSHGCNLPLGHEGPHVCEECSEYDHDAKKARYQYVDGSWSDWRDQPYGFQLTGSIG